MCVVSPWSNEPELIHEKGAPEKKSVHPNVRHVSVEYGEIKRSMTNSPAVMASIYHWSKPTLIILDDIFLILNAIWLFWMINLPSPLGIRGKNADFLRLDVRAEGQNLAVGRHSPSSIDSTLAPWRVRLPGRNWFNHHVQNMMYKTFDIV